MDANHLRFILVHFNTNEQIHDNNSKRLHLTGTGYGGAHVKNNSVPFIVGVYIYSTILTAVYNVKILYPVRFNISNIKENGPNN